MATKNIIEREDTVQTTDATWTTIYTYALATAHRASFEFHCMQIKTNDDTAYHKDHGTFKNVGGTVSQVGTGSMPDNDDDPGAVTWDVRFNISGTNIQFQVKGQTSSTITHFAHIHGHDYST